MNKITRSQFEQLEEAQFLLSTKEYHAVLEELTGIEARPYTGYSYYDSAGNYVGDSADCELADLLKTAYVEVENGCGAETAAKATKKSCQSMEQEVLK